MTKFAPEPFNLSTELHFQSRTCTRRCLSCDYSQNINLKPHCLSFLVQSLGTKLQVLMPVAYNLLLQWYCLISHLLLHQEFCYLQFNHVMFSADLHFGLWRNIAAKALVVYKAGKNSHSYSRKQKTQMKTFPCCLLSENDNIFKGEYFTLSLLT